MELYGDALHLVCLSRREHNSAADANAALARSTAEHAFALQDMINLVSLLMTVDRRSLPRFPTGDAYRAPLRFREKFLDMVGERKLSRPG
jgi:hypothetical protein